ncbi:hypothetical protein SLEP1_g9469 [Rubroshorea leprosula]|uniref:Uncharacterized protein n=1 Tax=Rubroshorea leprosula TaxID=152421 RepID=A0AAV5IG05_9ROSI|nr:hypothetical protein SLEP1_g9469 [Rubroshorea leprosula]
MDKEQTVLLEMHDEERKQRQESEEKLRARLRRLLPPLMSYLRS